MNFIIKSYAESDEVDEGPDEKQRKQIILESDLQAIEDYTDDKNDHDDETVKVKEIKRKLSITNEIDTEELNESFLDDELIRELLIVYLRENGVKKCDFASLILKIHPTHLSGQFAAHCMWYNRSHLVKRLYHKIKKILSIKAYSPAMKAVEIDIFKQRMKSLINLLNSTKLSHEEFARKHLELSLTDFETLMNNCMQRIPLDNRSKEYMNIIAEFIAKERSEQAQRYDTFKRPIKGEYFKI